MAMKTDTENNPGVISCVEDILRLMPGLPRSSFFRGEPKEFGNDSHKCGMIRSCSTEELNLRLSPVKIYERREQMIERFYQHVSASISAEEKKQFVAFSQHYGLPTSFLDISMNPLVSLYFACNKEPDDDGFVFLHIKPLINATEFIDSCANRNPLSIFSNEAYPEISTVLFSFNKVLKEYFRHQKDSCRNISQSFWGFISTLVSNISCDDVLPVLNYFGNETGTLLSCINDLLDYRTRETDPEAEHEFSLKYDVFVSNYCSFLCKLLRTSAYGTDTTEKTISVFDLLPNFQYIPTNMNRRIESQQSRFIYQWHISTAQYMHIVPDDRYRVPSRCKPEILRQLQQLAINRATVYSDFDNIAKYIRNEEV